MSQLHCMRHVRALMNGLSRTGCGHRSPFPWVTCSHGLASGADVTARRSYSRRTATWMAAGSLVIACLFCVATYLQDSTLLRYWYGAIAILFCLLALGFLRHVSRAVE